MSEAVCPCCGTPVSGRVDPRVLIAHIPLTTTQRTIVNFLVGHFGRDVATERVIDAAYAGVRDGGPTNAFATIKSHCHQLRGHLKPHGLTITRNYGTTRLEWSAA